VTVAGPRGPGISVIIVSYNVREILDACLQSVYHAAARFSGTVEVIVFDNESREIRRARRSSDLPAFR